MARVLTIIVEWYNFFTAMRSLFSNKFWIILMSVLALGALMGLAIGMKNMPFRAAQAFGQNEPRAKTTGPIRDVPVISIDSQVIIWAAVILMILLISLLLSPATRKRLLLFLLRVVLIYGVLYLFLMRYPDALTQLVPTLTPEPGAPAPGPGGPPAPAFAPPEPTSWVTYIFSLIIVAFLVFVVWRMYLTWRKRNALTSNISIENLRGIVRSSLNDLASGRDSSDVILNCYYRMSAAVAEKKNLDRRPSMTPNEFAARLEQAGLPGDAVKNLTRLFEAVRYGQSRSDSKMVNEAVTCLTAILQYCGETV